MYVNVNIAIATLAAGLVGVLWLGLRRYGVRLGAGLMVVGFDVLVVVAVMTRWRRGVALATMATDIDAKSEASKETEAAGTGRHAEG